MTMNSSRGIYQMFGIFSRGELEGVEETLEEAKHSAANMHSRQLEGGRTEPRIPKYCYIKPVFVLETDLNSHFLFGARQSLMEAQHELKEAQEEEKALIDEVTKAKGMMPNDYWHRRHKAFLVYTAYKQIVEALEQSTTEKFLNRA